MRSNSRAKYRRLLLVYSLVIIIPGVFLSLLAYKGIQGNWVAGQKISDDRLVRKSKYYTGDIIDTIDSCLDAFTKSQVKPGQSFFSIDDQSRAGNFIDQGLILNASIAEPGQRIKLLDKTTLFVPDDYWYNNDDKINPGNYLMEIHEAEFHREDLKKAFDMYTELAEINSLPLVRQKCYAGQARLLRKLGEYPAAMDKHREFIEASARELTNGTMHNGIIGKIEKLVSDAGNEGRFEEQNSPGRLLTIEMLEFLGYKHNYLTERDYLEILRNYQREYKSGINISSGGIKYSKVIDSLFSIINYDILRCIITNQLIIHINNNLYADVKTTGVARPACVPWYQDSLSVLLCFKLDPEINRAVILDSRELYSKSIPVLEEEIGFPNRIAWRLLDDRGKTIWTGPGFDEKDNSVKIKTNELGLWTLELQELYKTKLDLLWDTGQQLFVFIFIFVIALMAIGLFVTIRSLTIDYRLSQLKSDFVSTVSHEFKSPLTSIRMMSERLANQRVATEKRKQEYYDSMLAQSERLSHLVENILDFSRMDKGKKNYHFEACNIVKIAREVTNYLLVRHVEEGFEITIKTNEDPLIVMVDPQGIHQVFYNLVENAIKYSGDSRSIDILMERKSDKVMFTVRDYGIGISRKDQGRIFKQFYRGEKTRREGIKGSGIGLSIVNEIIKAHHGRIDLQSEPGRGSAFTCYIPVNQK